MKLTTNIRKFSTTSEALSLNSKIGVIRSEKYGNLLSGIHSGYALPERPLEAEFLQHLHVVVKGT